MGRMFMIALIMLVFVAGSAWHYRARIIAYINPPPSASRPAESPDVLYSWVDDDGVTHFSARPGKGERLEFDGSRITPVDVVEAPLITTPDVAGDEASTGNAIKDVKAEMERNARIMSEAKAAQRDL